MDTVQVSQEELAAEQAATKVLKEEEVRAAIVTEFGFDETADAEKIDKLVAKEMEHAKKLSSAIGQKIKHRTEAETLKKSAKPAEDKPPTPPAPKGDLSSKDMFALIEAKVPQTDVDDIVEYAKFKNISVAEALNSDVVKTMLSTKAEQRSSAEAANVGTSKRGTGKVPDDVLLSNASKGVMPESDADLARLVALRKAPRK